MSRQPVMCSCGEDYTEMNLASTRKAYGTTWECPDCDAEVIAP